MTTIIGNSVHAPAFKGGKQSKIFEAIDRSARQTKFNQMPKAEQQEIIIRDSSMYIAKHLKEIILKALKIKK